MTKSIGIVPELFASRLLFICFILIFTTSHDIDTTNIFSVNFNGFGRLTDEPCSGDNSYEQVDKGA